MLMRCCVQFLYRQLLVHPKATSKQDVDLSGKAAIITGSSGGIGLECAHQLLDLGVSKLILTVRNESKATTLVDGLSAGYSPKPTVEVWSLDYLSYDSIISLVERANHLERLDIVIPNAGICRTTMNIVPSTSHEENIQVNYLRTMLLLTRLLPVLKAKAPGSEPGRITVVSSDTAAWYNLKEKDQDPLLPSFDKKGPRFNYLKRYATSGLTRGADGTPLGVFAGIMIRLLGRSPSVGARTVIDAAVNHGFEVHGQYMEDCKLTPGVMAPFVYTPDGSQVTPKLWKETMNEVSFVGVEGII
ncbi:NAD(P)-binding protein [Xylariaceae sp. AK1471]|nr:NAD(P)-binding protein [Xylariaceae sp. AK1471]